MDKNPAQLSDDELDATIEALLADTPPEETVVEEEPKKPETPPADPAEEELPKEEEGKKPAPEQEEEGEKKTEEPKKPEGEPSRREQLRIEKLLQRYPNLQEPKQPEQPQAGPTTPSIEGLMDLDNDLDASDELKARLKADRDAAVKAATEAARKEGSDIEQKLATNLFRTRLEIDAPRVEAKYPFLDKTSDKFNPVAASAMNNKYLHHVGFNREKNTVDRPDVRYAEFVEAELEFAKEVVADEIVDSKKEVIKQAAQTGLRPGGQSPKKLNLNKLPSQMTNEELDAAIAQGLSS